VILKIERMFENVEPGKKMSDEKEREESLRGGRLSQLNKA
jgi:hypothetical protein